MRFIPLHRELTPIQILVEQEQQSLFSSRHILHYDLSFPPNTNNFGFFDTDVSVARGAGDLSYFADAYTDEG
jgi:hypothetical protein